MRRGAHGLAVIAAVLIGRPWAAAWGQQSEVRPQPDEEAIIEACSASEHREFDFWLGDW